MANVGNNRPNATSEEEPLLGQPGDATLESGQPLYYNLWLGELLLFFVPLRNPIQDLWTLGLEGRWRSSRNTEWMAR